MRRTLSAAFEFASNQRSLVPRGYHVMNTTIFLGTVALSTAFAACSPCNLGVEVSRIQAGQSNIVDCGTLVNTSSLATVRAAADCAQRAIDTHTPFKVFGQSIDHGTAYYAFISRFDGDRYTVFGLGFIDSNTPSSYISVGACLTDPTIEVVSFRDVAANLTWTCSDMDRSPAARNRLYNPPTSIPNGQICPVR